MTAENEKPVRKRTRPKAKKGRGRPAKFASEAERKASKLAYSRKYNRKYQSIRTKRYHEDPEYRAEILRASRERYRSNAEYTPKNFGRWWDRAEEHAVPLTLKGETEPSLVIPVKVMAFLCNVVPKVLSGWITQGKFPRPTHLLDDNTQAVYTVKEATALAHTLFLGLKGKATFRITDTTIIEKLLTTQLHASE